jgi:hypothetical protein
MQYVITNHNEGGFIILGPVSWNSRYFSAILSDELDVDIVITDYDKDRVPYEIMEGVKIRRCITEHAELDIKTETWSGPHVSYFNDEDEYQAILTWSKVDKPISQIKSEMKEQITKERYNRENSGVKITIQGIEVTCDTSRGNRDIFLQKYIMMGENDVVNWKFPESWLNLTKPELGAVVTAGAGYIQDQFNWELSKHTEIDSLTTIEDLKTYDLEIPTNTQPRE